MTNTPPNTPNITPVESSDTEDEIELETHTKEDANNFMKKGKYNSAINIYTKLIERDNINHILYSNRSVAYMKLNQYKHALKDSIKTTKLAPEWAKGWGRLGASLYKLNRIEQSHTAYLKAYELDNNELYHNMIKLTNQSDSNHSETNMDDLITNMMDNVMANSKIMNKISNPDFQKKVMAMQSTPFMALKDNDIMDVISMMIGSKIKKE
jgi:tetratricopeptide (TPR) repeat protein